MALHFDCRACGTQHPSRLRIGKPHLLRMVMGAFGEVLEPCPLTGRWVPVRIDDLHWSADSSASADLWRPLPPLPELAGQPAPPAPLHS
ncbi:MAG TPA: hypothetical protein VFZ18_05095 [Longimicrobiaceae bacterium]